MYTSGAAAGGGGGDSKSYFIIIPGLAICIARSQYLQQQSVVFSCTGSLGPHSLEK